MFSTIIDSTEGLTFLNVLLCTLASLGIGIVLAVVYRLTEKKCSPSFLFTVIMLPVAVQTVIMMVNGNLGVGVAVAGAFALVRFRSVPGNAKEICILFCVMACGLATGMGYLTFALLMAGIMAAVFLILGFLPIDKLQGDERIVKVLMPENMDYDEAFADVFERYASRQELLKVKTVELGSLYQLTYSVTLKRGVTEKQLIDEMRIRNGNLTISCSKLSENAVEKL